MNTKEENEKLDWMYKGANSLIDREDYLLGKSVDKPLEQLNNEEKEKRLGTVLPKNHVEHECIPPSIRDFNKIIQAEQVDLSAKLQEDPLVAIRKQEEEARRQFLQNPVQLKKLQDALNSQKMKKEKKKRKKNKKSDSDLDEQLKSKLKKLKNGQFPMMLSGKREKECKNDDLDTILMHKFNVLKDKLSQKDLDDIIAGKLSDSDEEKIERESSDTSRGDEKYGKNKKQYKNAEDRGKSREKYIPKQTHRSRSGSKYNHKRTNSRNNSSGEESDQDSRKKRKANEEVQKKRHRSSSGEKSNRRDKSGSKYTRKRTPSSSEDSEHERKKSNSTKESRKKRNSSEEKIRRKDINKNDSKYSCERLPSSSSEESECERNKRKSSRESKSNQISSHSKDRIKSKDSNRDDSKYSYKIKHRSSSEESDDDRNMRKATKEPPSRRKDTRKGSKYNNKERGSSEDSEHDRKQRKSHSKKKQRSRSSSTETTSRKVGNKKHSSREKLNEKEKKSNTVADSGKDLDRLILERLRMLRDSDPVKRGNRHEKNSNGRESVEKDHSHYDSDNDRDVPKQKAFGLVRADGTKIPFKGKYHEEKAYEPAKKQDAQKKNDVKKTKRLTDEEKEKIRKQMMADAAEREVERSESLKRYREENEREEQNSGKYDKSFVHKELLKSTKNATVEGRVKAKLNTIQKSSQHMNYNFSKR